MLRKVNVTDP